MKLGRVITTVLRDGGKFSIEQFNMKPRSSVVAVHLQKGSRCFALLHRGVNLVFLFSFFFFFFFEGRDSYSRSSRVANVLCRTRNAPIRAEKLLDTTFRFDYRSPQGLSSFFFFFFLYRRVSRFILIRVRS